MKSKLKLSFLLNYVVGFYLVALHIWAYVYTPVEPFSNGYEKIAFSLSEDRFRSYFTFFIIILSLFIISIREYSEKYGLYFAGINLGIGLMILPNYHPGYFLGLLLFSGVLKDAGSKNT